MEWLTWAKLEVVPAARAFLWSLVRWWLMTGLILAPASLLRRLLPGEMGSHAGDCMACRPDIADI